MPASIGVNLRVTGHCSQGGRKYMEDLFSVAYQQTEDERDLEYAFFGIYDGHGGSEAAAFAKEHLMDSIVKQRQFWSDNDEDVLKAIRNGYMLTHLNMWKELEKWPKTVTGLPSTAGTTASIAFIRRGKIYIGHVGDSAIVLGYQKEGCEEWAAKPLTSDHKPESTIEIERIQKCGGKVVSKAGVPRVVWNRPRLGHKGPIKKNTPMDEIPFLAVARSLGDLWSYNPHNDEFIVSPDPDVGVLTIDSTKFRCLIFGTDGLWNMISPEGAVSLVQATERHNEAALVGGNGNQPRDWLNPSKSLVDHALERWSNTRMRADNTSVVTLMLDPPGPPRATVLRSRASAAPPRALPPTGLTIVTRYSDAPPAPPVPPAPPAPAAPLAPPAPLAETTGYGDPSESYFMARLLSRTRLVNTLSAIPDELAAETLPSDVEPVPADPEPTPATLLPDAEADEPPDRPPRTSLNDEPASPSPPPVDSPPGPGDDDDGRIQINEVSSSSPTEAPPRPRGRRTRGDARREPASPPVGQPVGPSPAAPTMVPPARVLRSHDAEPRVPPTRQVATRARPAPPAPAAAPGLDRVVILTRRAPAASTTVPPVPPPRTDRPIADSKVPGRRAPPPPPVELRADDEPRTTTRTTRSAAPLAAKITRSIGAYARSLRGAAAGAAGNCARAPGPARRGPAARTARCKENLLGAGAAGGAGGARGASPRPGRRAASDAPAPRALRSRNESEAPPQKRARGEDAARPHKRAAWPPARLRRRRLK